MSLKTTGIIEIPGAAGSAFDHGIFDTKSRRVFIAHTAKSTVEVIDPDAGCHVAALPGFPGVAGAVADDGAAIVKRLALGIAACIGDDSETPSLHAFRLTDGHQLKLDLPGRPRWCVTDAAAERLFLCIREPSMILVAGLPDLRPLAQWRLPSDGAHGLDIDHASERLYAACDAGDLVEVDSRSGEVTNVWPIAGPPDVTFFNPATGRVHIEIGEPGLVETIDPKTGKTMRTVTGADAHTAVLVPPDRLYVISPAHGGVLVLEDA